VVLKERDYCVYVFIFISAICKLYCDYYWRRGGESQNYEIPDHGMSLKI
jgi:hypothetical protein